MTVVNPKSISGITSITMPSGGDNVLTIHTNNGVERFRIDSSGNVKVGSAATISPDGDLFVTGVTTATTYSGSAASLTNVPAANVVGVHTSLTVTNATTTGTAVVGGGVTISESGIEASGIGITCANINGTQIGGRRNLIINGAMNIAQRGTSSTSVGYQTVDRITTAYAGTDESPTFTQHTLTSSDTGPYEEGFRNSFHIQNGDQTSGAGAADEISMTYNVEAQDLERSGWNYASASSFITISFWVKSSVSQTFQTNMRLYGPSNANQRELCFAYSASSTWTKVVKTIPGASGNTLRSDNALGMFIQFAQFYGTNYTANSRNQDVWEIKNNNQNYKDFTTTWYTTNDATWEITGLQLEVGSQATPFEHRNFGEELALCQRYFYKPDINNNFLPAYQYHANYKMSVVEFPVTMRATPTGTATWSASATFTQNYNNSKSHYKTYINSNYDDNESFYLMTFQADAEI